MSEQFYSRKRDRVRAIEIQPTIECLQALVTFPGVRSASLRATGGFQNDNAPRLWADIGVSEVEWQRGAYFVHEDGTTSSYGARRFHETYELAHDAMVVQSDYESEPLEAQKEYKARTYIGKVSQRNTNYFYVRVEASRSAAPPMNQTVEVHV